MDFDLEILAQSFDQRTVEDLYSSLGCGDISLNRIINRLSEVNKSPDPLLEIKPPTEVKDNGTTITVVGLKGILTSLARCCNPAPGDEIVGYITRGRGATIHRRDCPNILRLTEGERIVKVSWGEPHRTFPVAIQIRAYDRQGLMNDISAILNNESINLVDINVKFSHNQAVINLVLEVGNIAQLSRTLTRIENLPNIIEANRLKPG